MFQSLQSSRLKWSQLVVLQEKPSKHHEAIESSVQSAQHVPLQYEYYSKVVAETYSETCCIIANIFENSIWKTAQEVVAEINKTELLETLKRPLFNHLQAIVAQVEYFQTAQIPKKTFWKCSQFVALQRQKQIPIPMLQAIEHSSRKLRQIHVFQMQMPGGGGSPAS